MAENKIRIASRFTWSEKKATAALLLAEGYTQVAVGRQVSVSPRSIRTWLAEPEFSIEVDRLTSMIGIASRAGRLRIAHRAIRAKVSEETVTTDKDLLDWLKYAQGETDGIRLGLYPALFEILSSVAGGGPSGTEPEG